MNWEKIYAGLVEAYHMTFDEISNLTIPQLQALMLKGERTCTAEQIERWAKKVREKANGN